MKVSRIQTRHSGVGRTVVVCGLGNVGAPLVLLVAQTPRVGAVTLLDAGAYDASNLTTQGVLPGDVGRPKALVQARRLAQLRPDVTITAINGRLEDTPVGLLRGDVIVCGFDSRRSRLALNEAAFSLGVPWVDMAVDGQGLLAQVAMYMPGFDQPCYECQFSADEYAAVEQTHACGTAEAAPTNAPAALGNLAAAMAGLELRRLLLDVDPPSTLAGKSVMIDARSHKMWSTTVRRNTDCRFHHRVGSPPAPVADPRIVSAADLLVKLDNASNTDRGDDATLALRGQTFYAALLCPACGTLRRNAGLARALRLRPKQCRQCREPLEIPGFAESDAMRLSAAVLRRPLAALGMLTGDVVDVHRGLNSMTFELGGTP